MNTEQNLTVQYVGFETHALPDFFLRIWKPIAQNFKNMGTLKIDIYKVENRAAGLHYLSRNIWPTEVYTRVFPDGIPKPVRNPFVKVYQYGGFSVPPNEGQILEHCWLKLGNEGHFPRITDKIPHHFATESSHQLPDSLNLKYLMSL